VEITTGDGCPYDKQVVNLCAVAEPGGPVTGWELEYGNMRHIRTGGPLKATMDDLLGAWVAKDASNGWHYVTVSRDGDSVTWSNQAGLSWKLDVKEERGSLSITNGEGNPYEQDKPVPVYLLDFKADPDKEVSWELQVLGTRFFKQDVPPITEDLFLCRWGAKEPQNDWHHVVIHRVGDKLMWTNVAGVSWSLDVEQGERNVKVTTGDGCPYGKGAVNLIPILKPGRPVTSWELEYNGTQHVNAGGPMPPATMDVLLGCWCMLNPDELWQVATISRDGDSVIWSNRAGDAWKLNVEEKDGSIVVMNGEGNPYKQDKPVPVLLVNFLPGSNKEWQLHTNNLIFFRS